MSINFLPIENFQNRHLEKDMTRITPNLLFHGETAVLPMTGISGKIHGVDKIQTEITGKNPIADINPVGIDQELPLETATLKGVMKAETGIDLQATEGEETSREQLVIDPTAGTEVDLQAAEMGELRIVFGVAIHM